MLLKKIIKLISIGLRVFSILFFILFFLSFFLVGTTFFGFLTHNFYFFQRNLFQPENISEIKLYHPGPLDINKLDLDLKVRLLNRTFDFLMVRGKLKSREYNTLHLIYNKNSFEKELENYFFSLLKDIGDVNQVRSKIIEELKLSKVACLLEIGIGELSDFVLSFETSIQGFIKI